MLIRVAVLMGPILLSAVILLLYNLIIPGKRGKLGTERTHFYDNMDVEKLRKFMKTRLLSEDFRMKKGDDPYVLEASRQKPRPAKSQMDPYPFHKLPLEVRVEFLPHSDGCQARMMVKSRTYIYRDTGEVNYMEAFLDYLMGKKVFRDVKPDVNEFTRSAAIGACFSLVIPWAIVAMDASDKMTRTIIEGNSILAVTEIVLAIWGMIQIGMKPTRTYGYLWGVAAIFIGFGGLLSTVAAFVAQSGN